MHKFTIKRRFWLNGEGSNKSCLYRDFDGRKCCLGFYLESLGVSLDDMLDISDPHELFRIATHDFRHLIPAWLTKTEVGSDVAQIIDINDSREVWDGKRENLLKELFAKHDVEVTFED